MCPICSVPQAADERAFNEHIDGCLSRQTIKEIVKTTDEPPTRVLSPVPANTAKRKRGRPPAGAKSLDGGEAERKAKRAFFT